VIASPRGHDDKQHVGAARAYVSLDDLFRLRGRAKGFSFLPRQPVHSLLSGRHASRLRGRGLNFEELRRYVPGDDTRMIDWLATARLGAPHVRVYTEERDRPVLLLVDQRSAMFFGSRRAMKSVAAAEAAALAAWRVTSLGDRIGAIVFGDVDLVTVSPHGRERGVTRVLSEIARQNYALLTNDVVAGAEGQLNRALSRALEMAPHDWLVCLVSDAAGVDDATPALVSRIMEHNDLLAIFVYDPIEFALPDVGVATFAWGGRQIEADLSSHALRNRFAQDQTQWRARLASLSRTRAIPVLPISTDREVAAQLRELIGARAERKTADLQPRR
jgi:uncharacterized protein (DUF58 family)